jgi:hypothetical protein
MKISEALSEGYSSAKYMQPSTRKPLGIVMLVALGLCALSANPVGALVMTGVLSCGLSTVSAALEKKSGAEIAMAPVKSAGFWAGLAVQTAKDIKNGISKLLSRGNSGTSRSFVSPPAAESSIGSRLRKVFSAKPAFAAAQSAKPANDAAPAAKPAAPSVPKA